MLMGRQGNGNHQLIGRVELVPLVPTWNGAPVRARMGRSDRGSHPLGAVIPLVPTVAKPHEGVRVESLRSLAGAVRWLSNLVRETPRLTVYGFAVAETSVRGEGQGHVAPRVRGGI